MEMKPDLKVFYDEDFEVTFFCQKSFPMFCCYRRFRTRSAMMAATTLAAAPQMRAVASTTTASRTARVAAAPLARQLRRGASALRQATTLSTRNNNNNNNKKNISPRAFAPLTGDLSITLPEGAAALAIVLGSRVALIGQERVAAALSLTPPSSLSLSAAAPHILDAPTSPPKNKISTKKYT
jgi:hypothetical protein